MDYTGMINYKNDEHYAQQYNGLIEHFKMRVPKKYKKYKKNKKIKKQIANSTHIRNNISFDNPNIQKQIINSSDIKDKIIHNLNIEKQFVDDPHVRNKMIVDDPNIKKQLVDNAHVRNKMIVNNKKKTMDTDVVPNELKLAANKLNVYRTTIRSPVYNAGGNASDLVDKPDDESQELLIRRVVKMPDKDFDEAYNMLKKHTPKYVSQTVWGDHCGSNVDRTVNLFENNMPYDGLCALKIYRDRIISVGYDDNNDDMLNNEEDDDEDDVLDNEEHDVMNNKKNCKNLKHRLKRRLKSRLKYITMFQNSVIQDNKNKNVMLRSDIQTKDRQIQINRYEYFKQKNIIFYCKLVIVICGLMSIVYSVGIKYPDKKVIFNTLSIVILAIGVVLFGMKLYRDSIRDNLDWDAIKFPVNNWNVSGDSTMDVSVKTCDCPTSE